jgi:hypothetical protein
MLGEKEGHMKGILVVLCLVVMMATPEKVGHQALKEVKWDWRPAGWKEIEFEPATERLLGRTYFEEKRIVIWVRPGQSPKKVASTIVHELAHAFSHLYLDKEKRREWLKTRGLPLDTVWSSVESEKEDSSTGAGDFAESVAWTLQGYSFNGRLKSTPNKRERALIRKWLAELPKGRP